MTLPLSVHASCKEFLGRGGAGFMVGIVEASSAYLGSWVGPSPKASPRAILDFVYCILKPVLDISCLVFICLSMRHILGFGAILEN